MIQRTPAGSSFRLLASTFYSLSLEPENEVKDIHSRNSQSLMAEKYVIDQERERERGGIGERERKKN